MLVLRHVDESHGDDTALDTRGLVLVTGGALGLVWGLVRGTEAGWTSPEVGAALLAGALGMVAFVRWQLRAPAPMLPMTLFGSRAFSAGMAASFLLFAALYGSVFFLAQFLQTGLGYTPLEAGLRLVPWTAPLFVIAPLAGALADRLGDRPLLIRGLTLNGLGLAWIALLAAPNATYSALVVPLIVTGIGASVAIPVVQNAILGAVAPHLVGKASGANSSTQELGGVFGVAILVVVFTAAGSYTSAESFTSGFTSTLIVCSGLALAAAITAFALPGRSRAHDAHRSTAVSSG